MPAMAGKLWTSGRKWGANLLPALFYLPPAVAGITILVKRSEFGGLGLWLLLGAVACGWISLNFLALVGNGFMRRQLRREIAAKEGLPDDAVFVGFASPGFQSVLDPHEDVGYLVLLEERLEFIGETHRVKIPRGAIEKVGFRPNVHTWVGLGRWVSVEGKVEGQQVRLLVEPREKQTLLGNLQYGKKVATRIRDWSGAKSINGKPRDTKPGAP